MKESDVKGMIGVKFVKVGIISAIDRSIVNITGTVVGAVTDGYNLYRGGWSCYADKDGTSKPAVFVGIKKKGFRKVSTFPLERVESITKI